MNVLKIIIIIIITIIIIINIGLPGGVVGLGTMLQTGRSWVRVPMRTMTCLQFT
jgi:hypothetical protein